MKQHYFSAVFVTQKGNMLVYIIHRKIVKFNQTNKL